MILRTLPLVLTTTALLAQTHSPLHFANAEGPNNNVFPFGNTTVPFRYTQIHDDVPAMVITGMAFRHNSATVTYQAHTITIDAWMSTAVTPSGGLSATFDNNHGPDKIQVVFNRTYSLPASNPADLPGEFVLDYPLDVPFVFAGNGASLCWEVHVTAKTQTSSVTYDAASGSATTAANPAMVIGRYGTGCIATGQVNPMTAVAVQTTSWLSATATMTVNGTNLEPNGVSVFCTGADNTSFGGIPLPATIPGSSCTVYSDIILATVVFNSATGTGTNAFTFTPLPAYHGLTFYSQIWGLDAAANPLGLTTSNAAMHHIVAPYVAPVPVSRGWSSGNLNPSGSTGLGYGLVTRFY